MRVALPLLVAVIPILAIAACNRAANTAEAPKSGQVAIAPVAPTPKPPPAPAITAPTGFHHEAGFDATGYYMPASQVRVGNFELEHISIGAPSDFATWEGGDRENAFGPILLHFNDVTSPMQQNEMGGENHSVSLRVLPGAYNIDSHTLSFSGTAPQIGAVVLQARFDPAALERAKNSGESANVPVVTGTLMIGERRFENLSFTYFAGD